jgi:O-antigen/teichoic acid export membrane protein
VKALFERIRNAPVFHGSGWALGAQMASLVTSLISMPLLTTSFGPALYGAFIAIYSLIGPASGFTSTGISLSVYERVVRDGADPVDNARSYMSVAIVFGTLFSIGAVLLAAAFNFGLPTKLAVLLIVTDLLLFAVVNMLIAVIQASDGFIPAVKIRIVMGLCRAIVILALWATHSISLRNIAVYQYAMMVLIGLVVYRRACVVLKATLYPTRFGWEHLKIAGQYALATSASNVQNDGDKVAMEAAGHHHDAGLYGAAYRMVAMGLMPVAALVDSTHLGFLDRSDPRSAFERAVKPAKIGLAYSVVFVIGAWIGAPLIPMILGNEWSGTVTIVRALSFLVVFRATSGFAMNAMLTIGRNALRSSLNVFAALLSVGLYAALVPPFSWKGAVAATLIGEATLTCLAWAVVWRYGQQPVTVSEAEVAEPAEFLAEDPYAEW